MATTLQNFVLLTKAALVGSTVQAANYLAALNPANATQIANGGSGVIVDKLTVDSSNDGYAKHGVVYLALTGTTPVTIDLTDLTSSGTLTTAGDTTFATWNKITLNNAVAGTPADVTYGAGGSNGARTLLAGTTPTLTVPANSIVSLASAAGLAVDSTHKTITITPTAGGAVTIAVSGS